MDLEIILVELRSQRTRLDQAISALEESAGPSARRAGRPPKAASITRRQGRRHMSAAARKRISEAMKQRWANRKRKSGREKTEPRRGMSAAARKKLSALMKARWAARRKTKV